MGRQAANTKLSSNVSVRTVRVRGGNHKFRALRLDSGNFSWGSEAVTRKTRLLDVAYNSSNNELVRQWLLYIMCLSAVSFSDIAVPGTHRPSLRHDTIMVVRPAGRRRPSRAQSLLARRRRPPDLDCRR